MADDNSPPTTVTPRPARPWIGWILLAVLGLAQRAPTWFSTTRFNPDEALYEAGAAYLVSTQQPAVALNHNMVFVTMVYRWVAEVFGIYQMAPIRILVTAIAIGAAILIFETVRRHANDLWGVIAGIVFLGFTHLNEGYTCNREWFSLVWILLSVRMMSPLLRGLVAGALPTWVDHLQWTLAGAAMSGAWWFKDQSLPFLGAGPATLIFLAIAQQITWPRIVGGLVCYSLGLVLGMAGYLACFAYYGMLGEHLRFMTDWISVYAVQSSAAKMRTIGLRQYLGAYFFLSPHRLLLGLSYLTTGIVLWRGLRKWQGSQAKPALRADLSLWTIMMLAGLAAISAGHRFFLHYYLYMCPSVAVLATLLLAAPYQRSTQTARVSVVGLVGLMIVAGLLLLEFVRRSTPNDPIVLGPEWLLTAVVTALTSWAAWRAFAGHAATTKLARLRPVAWGVVMGLLASQGLIALKAAWQLNEVFSKYVMARAIGAAIRQLANGPDDYLLSWGFYPECYSQSGLIPATRFAFCAQLMNDIQPVPTLCTMQPRLEPLFWADMEARPPRFILDATMASHTASNRHVYALERTPKLQAYIAEKYRLVDTVYFCPLYERLP